MTAEAQPQSLVSTEWLAQHLGDPDLRIVDGSFKLPGMLPLAREDYDRQHIPGAVYFDIDEIADHSIDLPHMLPSDAEMAAHMRRLGLGDRHKIVVYDTGTLSTAPRVWWTLRVYGHRDVAILDGGLAKWLAEARPVTQEAPAPPPAEFSARLDRHQVRDKAQLLANLASPREQVVDARAAARFAGSVPEPRPGLRSGHIPGARNLPYTNLLDAEHKTWLPASAIEAQFRAAGIDKGQPIVCSCGSGVTACALAFGLHLIGWPEATIYDGSWSEWGMPGETPIATGPA
jgi:thiosulfate/3-mercaptopyruvate sulfurtransferase